MTLHDDAHDLSTRALAFMEDHAEAMQDAWLGRSVVLVLGAASLLLDRIAGGES